MENAEITNLLEPGETVVWQAQPRPSVFLLRGLPNLAYGVTWSVLGAFWYYGSGGIGRYSAFEGWWKLTPLFSVPFILAGFSFFFYPIRLGHRARHTWYFITNRRAFTVEIYQHRPQQLRIYGPDHLAALQVVKRIDGLDDVLLSRRALENPHLTPRLEDGFFGVENGVGAAQAIRALKTPLS